MRHQKQGSNPKRNAFAGNYLFFLIGVIVCATWTLGGCSNTPYPGADKDAEVVYYTSFRDPPKDLDPQTSYTSVDAKYLSLYYESLLDYDFLKRPIQLQPELAQEVPEPQVKKDNAGKVIEVRYHFDIHTGVFFQDDPCFLGGEPTASSLGKGRELNASDFEFAFKRMADPRTNCPVVASFSHLKGFDDFRGRLDAARNENPDMPVSKLYKTAGLFPGIEVNGAYSFDMVLETPYPQILYWLAMSFVCALPHEAVEYYDGKTHAGEEKPRPTFREHPVGTGPYHFDWEAFDRYARIIMVKNERWRGILYPEKNAPGTIFPMEAGEVEDLQRGIFEPALAGKPLPFIDRIEWYLEREQLPRFSKFLQGYYDGASIPKESFDQVVEGDRLTPEMETREIKLVKDVELAIHYIGFNMDDDVVGAPVKFRNPALEKERERHLEHHRKLRKAMSLAIDTEEYMRIFFNGLGVPAQSPLPPGLFGYDVSYRNPYRQYDPELKFARRLLREAGYENGIDPVTGKPLVLTFDVPSPRTQSRVRYNFFIDAWRKLGLDVRLAATDYNRFQTKMQDGNYQIFTWGWLADYPDPENFFFLLYSPNSSKSDGRKPNSARFENAAYDFLFKKMETLSNKAAATWVETDANTGKEKTVRKTRHEIIQELIRILEAECPWIPLLHRETYNLHHDWHRHIKPHPIAYGLKKYHTIDKEKRSHLRKEWNRPIRWPVLVLGIATVLMVAPAIRVFLRERR